MGLYMKQNRDKLLVVGMYGRLITKKLESMLNVVKETRSTAITLWDVLRGVYIIWIFGHIFAIICFVSECVYYYLILTLICRTIAINTLILFI